MFKLINWKERVMTHVAGSFSEHGSDGFLRDLLLKNQMIWGL